MAYIFDSYAWVEYFLGTRKGLRVRRIIISNSKIFTLECNLAEIYEWALREDKDFNFILKFIESNSELLPINITDWIKAVDIKLQMRKSRKDFGLIDSLMIVKQDELNCKIVTGDKHFLDLRGVMLI